MNFIEKSTDMNSTNFVLFLKKIQLYCFILLPLLILTGPFLPGLSISIIGLIFLLLSFFEKNKKYYNIFFYIFVIWCLYLVLLSLFSDSIYHSLSTSLFYFRFGFFVLGAWYVLVNNKDALKYFSFSLFIVFIFALLDGYLQYFFGFDVLGYPYNGVRLSLLGGKELVLGSFLSRLFPIFFILSFFYFNKNKKSLIFLCTILILTDVLIYVSGERTAFFYLFMSVILLILMMKNFKAIRIISFIISLCLILLISFSNDTIKSRMVDQTLSDLNINFNESNSEKLNTQNNQKKDPTSEITKSKKEDLSDNKPQANKFKVFSSAHEALFLSALHIYKDKTNYIFGIGPKMFRLLCLEEKYLTMYGYNSCSTHPHNTYIQVLVEVGLIGFLPILILVIYVYIKIFYHIYLTIFKNKPILDDLQIGMYIALAISLWPFVPTGSFFNSWLSIIYYLPFPFIFYFNNKTFLYEK